MKSENENANMDEMISKAIGSSKPAFDFEQWKQDHPEQIAAYKEQTTDKPHKLIKYAGIILSAAAMILLAVMLRPDANDNATQPVKYQAKILTEKISLPANAPTMVKLNLIFKNNDMQAVDTFNEQAAKGTGLQPEKMTAKQLMEEMETNSNKTEGIDHENRSYNNTDNIRSVA
jgi:hypothetical protein